MAASQIELAARGQEDRWLTESPSRTFFEAKYNPRINRLRETLEIPFDYQGVTFGTTGQSTIPVKGDYLTGLTLRAVLPPIYPTVPGQYVFPTPSSQVGGNVYVNMGLTQIVANGTTLTANTTGNHYFSIGAAVILTGTAYSIFDLDGTYTINGIPTANSFTCSTVLSGISYNGTVSTVGISCGDVVSYFSTQNSNLWVNNLTNKTWQITGGTNVGNVWTFTTSAPSNFPVGTSLVLNLSSSGLLNQVVTVSSSTDTTFTCIINDGFVMVGNDPDAIGAYSFNNISTWNISTFSMLYNYNTLTSVTSGNNVLVAVTSSDRISSPGVQFYSTNNGLTWTVAGSPLVGGWYSVTYGNGVFVMVSNDKQAYSTDNGLTWTIVASPLVGVWRNVTYGNGVFVMVGDNNIQARSADNGLTWTVTGSPLTGDWYSVTYGNGVFVMIGNDIQAYSTDNGLTFTAVGSPLVGYWRDVTYGNGVFVMTSFIPYIGFHGDGQAYSTDNGLTWIAAVSPLAGEWNSVTYGNGIFVMVGLNKQAYSTDNGLSWNIVNFPLPNYWYGVTSFNFSYTVSPSDSVSLVSPPLQLTNRVFSSSVYPSIFFTNASDAAFWGFDSRNGLTYSLPVTPPWSLVQSGWIPGFLPPSSSTWDDSVAHKLCKAIRIMVGKQTIKEYSGEYIELLNDLTVDYANKAILKLMNGTLDQTQAIVSREYYVSLALGTKEIPLCALTHQNMSVEIDFERYTNLSRSLNPGTGVFTDPKSFVTYNASTGILNGSPLNVQTTFSYQQYIFIVTYDGFFIIYDTTQPVSDSTSYTVLSAFSGISVFQQFCVLSGTLYIGLSDGTLARVVLDELIQGNISSFTLNNYTPTIGSLTGTIVADFRYVYYAVSNTVTSNVFVSQYDTTSSFTSSASYKTVDFTLNFNSSVDGVYQFISTGTELVMLPKGTPGSLYTYQFSANVQSQWYLLDYSSFGTQVSEGVVITNTLYLVIDNFNIIVYLNNVFNIYRLAPVLIAVTPSYGGQTKISRDYGQTWNNATVINTYSDIAFGDDTFVTCVTYNAGYTQDFGITWFNVSMVFSGNWTKIVFNNGTFVMTVNGGPYVGYSTDDGKTWHFQTVSLSGNSVTIGTATFVIPPFGWFGDVVSGNGVFIIFENNEVAYSSDGANWITISVPGLWVNAVFGNGLFVIIGQDQIACSSDNGQSWAINTVLGQWTGITYANGIFYIVSMDGKKAKSYDGQTWIVDSFTGTWNAISAAPGIVSSIPGNGLRNLTAVGNYIYCSTNNVAVQIDTTKDLSTAAAYTFPAPVPTGQYVFANGPRYVYLFSQGDPTAQNVYRFDPYQPNTTLQASIIVDYESLPEGVTKPDKALIGLVQTQKVTNMDVMDLHGPVKELWITGVADSANVFQYANLSNQVTLTFTAGEEMITPDTGTRKMLSVIQPFEMHTSMPIRNISTFSFEMDPESSTPNGTVNFSRIYEQALTANAATVWARNYNILAIQGGIGGLMFN